MFNPLNAVFRSAGFDGSFVDDFGCCDGALLRFRVEAEDDRVAGLQADQTFEDRGGSRIGDRSDAGDHADRFGNVGQTLNLIFLDDADRFQMTHVIDDIFASEQVFGRLVFEDAALGFLDRQLGQFAMLVQSGDRALGNDIIDLILIQFQKIVESFESFFNQLVDFLLCRAEFFFHLSTSSFVKSFTRCYGCDYSMPQND